MIRTKNYKVKCLFNDVVMWVHVAKKKRFISTSAGPMATKIEGMITYDEGSPLPMVTWHNSPLTNKKG